jgi:iron complex transport system substrate-binding protein
LLRAVALALAVFAASPAFADDPALIDAAGRTVQVADTSRIASIGGSVTEILYAIGLADRIVAVDLTSDFPAAAHQKANVGYMRALSPEGVLSVNPSLVLAVAGSGPADAIDVLESASVPFVLVPEAEDGAGVLRKIHFVAHAVGADSAGDALATAVASDLSALTDLRSRISAPRRAVFVLGMSGGAPLVAGSGTAADAIFALAGVKNALADVHGYKPASDEAVRAAAPDVVVVMSRGDHNLSADQIFALPAFAETPAAHDRHLVIVDGSYALGLGPRVAHAARDLAAAVYPELALPRLPDRPWVAGTPPAPPPNAQ